MKHVHEHATIGTMCRVLRVLCGVLAVIAPVSRPNPRNRPQFEIMCCISPQATRVDVRVLPKELPLRTALYHVLHEGRNLLHHRKQGTRALFATALAHCLTTGAVETFRLQRGYDCLARLRVARRGCQCFHGGAARCRAIDVSSEEGDSGTGTCACNIALVCLASNKQPARGAEGSHSFHRIRHGQKFVASAAQGGRKRYVWVTGGVQLSVFHNCRRDTLNAR